MNTFTDPELSRALKAVVPEPATPVDRAAQARRRAKRMRTRRRTALSSVVAAVALAVAVPTAVRLGEGPSSEPPSAATPSGPAPTAGAADPCAHQACDPDAVLEALRRPLDLPTVAPGEECPVSPSRRFPGGAGFSGEFAALGLGPVYLAGPQAGGKVTLPPPPAQAGGHWRSQKVIWVFDKTYSGAVLLRGDRIDGPGALGFLHYIGAAGYPGTGAGDGKAHPRVLYVRGGLTASPARWLLSYPGGVFAKGPGCYAVQVDGVDFSETLVFRATAP